jgi:hypothetical protein
MVHTSSGTGDSFEPNNSKIQRADQRSLERLNGDAPDVKMTVVGSGDPNKNVY